MHVSSVISWLLVIVLLAGCAPVGEAPDLVSPNIFLRGMQLPNGTRYAATFVKPSDEAELRDVLVEITLPANVVLTGMTVPGQAGVAEVRENGATRTLVWRVARVEPGQALDTFSFVLAEPLSEALEFYMLWHDAGGTEYVEHFAETPPVQAASQVEAQVTVTQTGYIAVGDSGVQVSAEFVDPPLNLTVRILPASVNPPAAYGNIWWCSIVDISGVPAGQSIRVMAPLRRPIAPFTPLILFHQASDGAWAPLQGIGVVTADGLFVEYEHPGGVVALGGDPALQPAAVSLSVATDGTSNTVVIGEATAAPVEQATQGAITDGSSNTVVIGEATAAPVEQATQGAITDGSSNTVVIGEATAAPVEQATQGAITDGSSNTVVIGEATAAPVEQATQGAITDGSSNTVLVGEQTPTPVVRVITATPSAQAPTAARPTPTSRPPINLAPVIALNPTPSGVRITPLGSGGVRVLILTNTGGIMQCQAGGAACSVLRRIRK